MVLIKYLGISAFEITTEKGVKIKASVSPDNIKVTYPSSGYTTYKGITVRGVKAKHSIKIASIPGKQPKKFLARVSS